MLYFSESNVNLEGTWYEQMINRCVWYIWQNRKPVGNEVCCLCNNHWPKYCLLHYNIGQLLAEKAQSEKETLDWTNIKFRKTLLVNVFLAQYVFQTQERFKFWVLKKSILWKFRLHVDKVGPYSLQIRHPIK